MLQVIHSISLMQEISPKKFLSDVKLLLFGIDSDSFKYNTVVCMQLILPNTMIFV